MRPSSCEHDGMGWQGPRRGRLCRIEADSPRGQLVEGWAGGTVVAVEAQVVRGHRVEHDQEHVRGTRRRQGPRCSRATPAIRSDSHRRARQDRHQTGGDRQARPHQPPESVEMPIQRRDQSRSRSPAPRPARPGRRSAGTRPGEAGGSSRRRALAPRASSPAVARPGPPATRRRPATGRGTGWPPGSARRNGGSFHRDDWNRTCACEQGSSRPRAVPRRARTMPRGSGKRGAEGRSPRSARGAAAVSACSDTDFDWSFLSVWVGDRR